jgi:hypothetical protein
MKIRNFNYFNSNKEGIKTLSVLENVALNLRKRFAG